MPVFKPYYDVGGKSPGLIMPDMSKAKKPPAKNDRHKKRPLTLRLDDRLHVGARQMADSFATSVTTEIAIALRERLEKHGFWPPKQEGR
jgi:hypothetical protein